MRQLSAGTILGTKNSNQCTDIEFEQKVHFGFGVTLALTLPCPLVPVMFLLLSALTSRLLYCTDRMLST